MDNNNFNDEEVKEFLNNSNDEDVDNSDTSDVIPIDFSVVDNYEKSHLMDIEDPDTLIESVNNIQTAYEQFGKEFGVDIKYDVHSVSSTFKSIVSSDAETVFKIYLVKSFSKVKLAVFQKILVAITTMVDRITQRDILESDNIELTVGLIEKLMGMMEQLNKVYAEIEITSPDTVLRKTAKDLQDESHESGSSEFDKDDIIQILKRIKNIRDDES